MADHQSLFNFEHSVDIKILESLIMMMDVDNVDDQQSSCEQV